MNLATYIGHTDAIWDIRLFPIHQSTQYLASASADGTVKIWDTEIIGSPLKCSWNYYGHDSGEMVNGDGKIFDENIYSVNTCINFIYIQIILITIYLY